MKLFYFLRIHWKLFKRKFISTNSFCKKCGRDVHDFSVPDVVWDEIDPHIKYGHTLCYDCFCDICKEIGLPTIWHCLPFLECNSLEPEYAECINDNLFDLAKD